MKHEDFIIEKGKTYGFNANVKKKFLFGRKYDFYEPEGELNASSGMFYQRGLTEFDNIKDFVTKYYPRNTIVIPLAADISAILGKDGWEDSGLIPSDIEIDYDILEGTINEEEGVSEEIKDQMINELFRGIYDYRLLNPYIIRDDDIIPVNIKMLGKTTCKGLVGKVCDILGFIDNKISGLPFEWAERFVNKCKKIYDSHMHDSKGNPLKMVIWAPLYNIADTDGICITLFDRIDIIIT